MTPMVGRILSQVVGTAARRPATVLAGTKPVKIVFGPGTFINESVGQIDDEFVREQSQAKQEAQQAAAAARKLALGRGYSRAQANRLAQEASKLRQAQFARDVIQLA